MCNQVQHRQKSGTAKNLAWAKTPHRQKPLQVGRSTWVCVYMGRQKPYAKIFCNYYLVAQKSFARTKTSQSFNKILAKNFERYPKNY